LTGAPLALALSCLLFSLWAQEHAPFQGSDHGELLNLPEAPGDEALRLRSPSFLDRLPSCRLPVEAERKIRQSFQQKDDVEAERELIQQIGSTSSNRACLLAASSLFFLHRQFLNAAIALKRADHLQPLDPVDRLTLCLAYIALGHGDWAAPELDRLITESPGEATFLYWRARIDYDDRRYPDAVAGFRKVLKLAPGSVKAHDNLALALEGTGDLDQALQTYGSAIALNRRASTPSPWPPLNRGTLLVRLNRTEEAEKDLEEALSYNKQLAQTHFRLGTVYEKEGKDEQAIREWQAASRLDPNYSDPVYALARLRFRQGKKEEAQQLINAFQTIRTRERQITGLPAPRQ
jgi:tetratricopeptide (TPR) repeat protein